MLGTELHAVRVSFDDGTVHPDFGKKLGWFVLCVCRWYTAHHESREAAQASGDAHLERMRPRL